MQKQKQSVQKQSAQKHQVTWRGRPRTIFVAQTAADVNAVLSSYPATDRAVPFDLEFLRNSNEPALVSVSVSPDVALLWHRPNPDAARQMPSGLAALLTSPTAVKIGFSIDDDLRKLAASTDLLGRGWPRSVLDIQALYRLFCSDRSVTSAVSMEEVVNALSTRSREAKDPFRKLAHDGDWSRQPLTRDQIVYAAGDVFIIWEVIETMNARLRLLDPKRSSKSSLSDDEKASGQLVEPIAAFLRQTFTNESRDLPRPERLRNYVVHSCPVVSRLRIGERRKAAAVELSLITLAQRGVILLDPVSKRLHLAPVDPSSRKPR
jgi:hypothetical protein